MDDNDDANGHDVFEEYEWAGQTRIRATSLLEGGFKGNLSFLGVACLTDKTTLWLSPSAKQH